MLQQSLQTQNPVRVLRSAVKHGNSTFAPKGGIRYDGLYLVVRQLDNKKNSLGGVYCCFEFERKSGQEELKSIALRSPTPQGLNDLENAMSQVDRW